MTTGTETLSPQHHRVASDVRAQQGRLKISGRELSRLTGINQVVLSRRLRGDVPFTFEELVLVTEALNMDIAPLVEHMSPSRGGVDPGDMTPHGRMTPSAPSPHDRLTR